MFYTIAAAIIALTPAQADAEVVKARAILAQTLDHYEDTRFRNVRIVESKNLTDDGTTIQFCGEMTDLTASVDAQGLNLSCSARPTASPRCS